MWTDASLYNALAFVYSNKGFFCLIQPPSVDTKVNIFFLKLLAILSAVHHVGFLTHPPHNLLIWTDSLDSIAILNSLHTAESMHNALLLAIADIILCTGMDLWVCFIEGKNNVHTNMLPCLLIDKYLCKLSANHIKYFTSPWELLPVQWRVYSSSVLAGRTTPHVPHPPLELADLNVQALYLQVNSIKQSTSKNYATGAHDYINFCVLHFLPLDPTPTTLSCYAAYSSQFIASRPKNLTDVWHCKSGGVVISTSCRYE
jgi:hypothetical protein